MCLPEAGTSAEVVRLPTPGDAKATTWRKGGVNAEGTRVKEIFRREAPASGPILVGVRGTWYDVTSYVKHHPGGDVILEYAGRDATAIFVANHDERILKRHKRAGEYEWDEARPKGDALEGDFLALAREFETEGLFVTSMAWFRSRLYIWAAFLAATLGLIAAYTRGWWPSPAVLVLAALALGGLWQQSGFLMHDLMHNHVFHQRRRDQNYGWFFGGVCFGIGARWWRDEHFEHHHFTNTYIEGVGRSDPQMGEDVWCIDPHLLPFCAAVLPRRALDFMLRFQAYFWLPLVTISRLLLQLDAVLSEDRRSEFAAMALHWGGSALAVCAFPSWGEGLLFLSLATFFCGTLHVQLLISHYAKPFAEKDAVKEGSYARRQLAVVVDVDSPPWLDWFHGGLNLHSVHHLYPRMCREHYRAAHPRVRALCRTHGVELTYVPFSRAVRMTMDHMGDVGAVCLKLCSAGAEGYVKYM